jgi:hypothetical protein
MKRAQLVVNALIILVFLAIVFRVFVLPPLARYWLMIEDTGPIHLFKLDSTPMFQTDDLATEKASKAIAIDGFDLAVWRPQADKRTKAPDGASDVFLSWNGITPNSGSIMFVNTRRDMYVLFVSVELQGDQLTCQVSKGR